MMYVRFFFFSSVRTNDWCAQRTSQLLCVASGIATRSGGPYRSAQKASVLARRGRVVQRALHMRCVSVTQSVSLVCANRYFVIVCDFVNVAFVQ